MPAGYSLPTVTALQFIRPMAGGAGSRLWACDDGKAYVVKPWNNPQGNRTLLNEVISIVLLSRFGIAHPPAAFVREAGQPGTLHFGSRYPGQPGTVSVYDYLPESTLTRVVNLEHFLGALVFDKWVSNADGRQAIFYRGRIASSSTGESVEWVAEMIDNGLAFQGPDWTFRDSPAQGTSRHRFLYRRHAGRDLDYWFDVLGAMNSEVFDLALAVLPQEWTAGAELAGAAALLRALARRKSRVRELVSATLSYLGH